MSEKEKVLIEKISKLPEELKERFTAMAEGAAMAHEMNAKNGKEAEDHGRD